MDQYGYLRIDSIGFAFIPVESDDRELSLDLAGIDADDADPLRNKLLAQAFGKRPDSSFCRTVNSTADIGLTARDGSDVDDVASPIAVVVFQHSG